MEILILTLMLAVPLVGLCSLPIIANSFEFKQAVPIRNRIKR